MLVLYSIVNARFAAAIAPYMLASPTKYKVKSFHSYPTGLETDSLIFDQTCLLIYSIGFAIPYCVYAPPPSDPNTGNQLYVANPEIT